MTLKTETNTTRMHHRVVMAAAKILNRPPSNIVAKFEHGQWWVEDLTLGGQYSVCDADGYAAGIVDGFMLKQVTEGHED